MFKRVVKLQLQNPAKSINPNVDRVGNDPVRSNQNMREMAEPAGDAESLGTKRLVRRHRGLATAALTAELASELASKCAHKGTTHSWLTLQ